MRGGSTTSQLMVNIFSSEIYIIMWCHPRRGITGIFSWGGKVIFPCFFPGVKCFFPAENSHIGRPKTNSVVFKSEKQKKRSSPLIITFPTSISKFPPSLLQFSFFSYQFSPFFPSSLLNSPLFPVFLASFFPDTSAKISRSEVSGGGGALCPLPVTPLHPGKIVAFCENRFCHN